jgi:sarcosine oxidase subunit gamma
MPEAVMESPLSGIGALGQDALRVDGKPCSLSEIPFVEMLNIRGNAAKPQFANAVAEATGLALPQRANSSSIQGERQLLWLGPDEWLLKQRDGQGSHVEAALRTALQGQHFSLVQVGSGNTTLSLQGPGSAALIARGCPLDLHARVFPAAAVAQSHISRAGLVLHCLEPGAHYELTVRRSFADYLFRWLCAAGD